MTLKVKVQKFVPGEWVHNNLFRKIKEMINEMKRKCEGGQLLE